MRKGNHRYQEKRRKEAISLGKGKKKEEWAGEGAKANKCILLSFPANNRVPLVRSRQG